MYESVYIMIDFNLGKKSVAFGRSQEVPMPEAADVPAASALHARTSHSVRHEHRLRHRRAAHRRRDPHDGAAGTVEILQRIGVASP
jgi:hypothetical protein